MSVAVCEPLKKTDSVFGTYRGHALYLAKGGDLKKMWAELYGKATGTGRGRSGSMHLADVEQGVVATSAVVASTVPLAVGSALSQQYFGKDDVTVCFLGDGAVDEGSVHEALLFASVKNVPVLFVCENNEYAIHSHHLDRHKNPNFIEDWAKSYGIKVQKFKTDDVVPLYDATTEAVKSMRAGGGPVFFECYTSRWKEHVGPSDDFNLGYRTTEEVEQWKERDQLRIIGEKLSEKDRQKIQKEVDDEVAAAIEFAERSNFPTIDDLYIDNYENSVH